MIIAILLMAAITTFFWILYKSGLVKICPICAGVSGTWLLMTLGILSGYLSVENKLIVAMLMGMTVVGIAFKGEEKFQWAQGSLFNWKAPVIIFGLPLAYFLFVRMSYWTVLADLLILSFVTYFFFIKPDGGEKHYDDRHVNELEKQMKKCC